MKFKDFGYTKEEVEVREMSMGNLIKLIGEKLIQIDKKDITINFVDLYEGDVTKIAGIEGLFLYHFNFDIRVKVYDLKFMIDRNGDDYVKVIMSDSLDLR